MTKQLILVVGPTASGKTDLAIKLALKNNCPIISADSRQIFKELNIGVAKPSEEQLQTVEHYFINYKSIFEDYNVADYVTDARHLINQLFEVNETLVICGGTGMYIQSLINGIDILPEKDIVLREKIQGQINIQGIEKVIEEYKYCISSELIQSKNPQRIIRTIEISESKTSMKADVPEFLWKIEIDLQYIELERTELYDRINIRVDHMIQDGLENEAKSFYKNRALNALKTVGYSEWWDYFEGKVKKEFVIEKIKQHSRNYAKRQITWFNNQLPKLKII